MFANKRMGADGPPGPLASSGPDQFALVRAAPKTHRFELELSMTRSCNFALQGRRL
jgi:hypothetical protein